MPGPGFLEGDRVTLNVAQAEDDEFLVRLWNEQSVRYPAGLRGPESADDLADVVGGSDDCRFIVCRDGQPIGDVMLFGVDWTARSGELAYAIHPDETGQGFATDAAGLCLRHAFEGMGLHRVRAKVVAGNDASIRVLEKLGFEHEGVRREAHYNQYGEYEDWHLFGILKSEWESAASPS